MYFLNFNTVPHVYPEVVNHVYVGPTSDLRKGEENKKNMTELPGDKVGSRPNK